MVNVRFGKRDPKTGAIHIRFDGVVVGAITHDSYDPITRRFGCTGYSVHITYGGKTLEATEAHLVDLKLRIVEKFGYYIPV